MTTRRTLTIGAAALALAACGTPAERPDGDGRGFARASMAGGGGPEAAVSGRQIELVSWLVQFNRLNSPSKLEAALNKKPGELVNVDLDRDGAPDFIAVTADPKPSRGAHGLALRARPTADAAANAEVHIATLFFDEDWGLLGYERIGGGSPPRPTAIAAAAATAAVRAATAPAPIPEPAAFVLRLRVPAAGALVVDGEALDRDDDLAARLQRLRRANPAITAIIEAEGAAAQPRVLAAVDRLREAGIDAINIHDPAPAGAPSAGAPAVVAVPAGSDEEAGLRPAG